MCLSVGLFGSNLFGTFWASWTCVFFLQSIREVLVIITSNRSLIPCLLSSPHGIPMIQMFCFMLSNCFLSPPHFLKSFFLFAALPVCFYSTLSSKSLIQSSASSNRLFIPSSVLYISDTVFFVSTCPFYGFCVFFHAI